MGAWPASGIGKRVGRWARRRGTAPITAKVAPRSTVVSRRQIPTIATQASRIGKQVGLWPRRHGVASTSAKAARQQAVVRRCATIVQSLRFDRGYVALASVPSSGALYLQTVDALGLVRWPLCHLPAYLTTGVQTSDAPCALAIAPSSGAQVCFKK